MRNAIRRRNHKERSQPVYRQKLGFLEKHKDYVQRAKDYHSKQDRLKKLREKAEFRNKDEFYFGMVGKKTSVRTYLYMYIIYLILLSARSTFPR